MRRLRARVSWHRARAAVERWRPHGGCELARRRGPPSLPSQPSSFRVSGTLTTAAPPDIAWAALTDYEAAPTIFASVASCADLGPAPGAPGGRLIEQAVGWSFLVFGGAFKMTLRVDEADAGEEEGGFETGAGANPSSPALGGARALAFTLVDSKYLSSFRGVWTVAPAGDGGCSVTHTLAVAPTATPPAAIRGLVQRLFKKQVSALLADLRAELERRA